ncbi:unnamed protein product, partial [Iphiclides podalirius]
MGGVAGASALLGVEICAPLLMLCWLCCWPDDGSSDKSSGRHPKKPVITNESGRHSGELFGRRFGSSAISLHVPGTSGFKKQPLAAHRSHEEIRSRRKSHHESREDPTRYHSAPSVIDEVLHRRDWERSARDLRIPLRPDALSANASPEHEHTAAVYKSDEEIIGRPCKKHHTNIKRSRKVNREATEPSTKESTRDDVKDQDATELTSVSNFYIGDASCTLNKENIETERRTEEKRFKAKDVKQCMNESIKCRDRPRNILGPLTELQVSGGFDEELDIDRSGAVHHFDEPRSSYCDTPSVPYPPLATESSGPVEIVPLMGATDVRRSALRGRHASAGDVLAPTLRPHSAALSESDLDFELDCCDEPPPAYDQLQLLSVANRKETAI